MSTSLNDIDTVQPLYASIHWSGTERRVQITLVGRSEAPITIQPIVPAAYLDVSVDYFAAWLQEVSGNLKRALASCSCPLPTSAASEAQLAAQCGDGHQGAGE